MADFEDFDIEIENSKESNPYTEIVTVATAGSAETVSAPGGLPIRAFTLFPPRLGPNVGTNTIGEYILYSTDGGTTYKTLSVNEWICEPGMIADGNLKIDASINGMKIEVEVRY